MRIKWDWRMGGIVNRGLEDLSQDILGLEIQGRENHGENRESDNGGVVEFD